MQKLFCADPARAGDVDFLLVGGFGLFDVIPTADEDERGPSAAGIDGRPVCRLAGFDEVAFALTRQSDGVVRTQRTGCLGGSFAVFQGIDPGDYTLTEEETGATSDPFEVGDIDAVTVVNWVETVDPTPGTGSGEDGGVSIHSLVCIDPARAGETDVLIGADPDATGPVRGRRVARVRRGGRRHLRDRPGRGRSGHRPGHGIVRMHGAGLPPGSYVLTIRATGETVGPFEVAANAPAHVTVVRWATEIEPRALVVIRKTTCPEDTENRPIVCGRNVLPDVGFTAAGDSATTDDRGIAFLGVPAGEVTIQEDPAVLAGYDGAAVHCEAIRFDEPPIGVRVLFDGRADGGAVQITVDEGDEVQCEWYNLTGAGVSPTPTRTATPTPTPTATPTPTPTAGATSGVTTLAVDGCETTDRARSDRGGCESRSRSQWRLRA